MRKWSPPSKARPYLTEIYNAERAYNIPPNLLARLIYQESRFRDDIIHGDVTSAAGAVGIAQIVPRWHPNVNPRDPVASIWYAANYLRELYDQFRPRVSDDLTGWKLALAAYNWGPGNQNRDLVDDVIGNEWPQETRAYVREIAGDVFVV